MSLEEMTTMVKILEKNDYDGRNKNYPRPNRRKEDIMDKVVHVLGRKYGVVRSKDQLRKRWSDLKHREEAQLCNIHHLIKKEKKKKAVKTSTVMTELNIITVDDTSPVSDKTTDEDDAEPGQRMIEVEADQPQDSCGSITSTTAHHLPVEQDLNTVTGQRFLSDLLKCSSELEKCSSELQKIKDHLTFVQKQFLVVIDTLTKI